MSLIDKIIHVIRSDLSDIACDHDKISDDLYKFIGVGSSRSYNFVLDSLYLFEDTQLAIESFTRTELKKQDFGTLYLLYYGVLNACYMQQQATLVVCREMGINDGLEKIKNAEIFNFRNSFSAHSPNRGRGPNEHSYILDRHAMIIGRVEGYSSNHKNGQLSLQGNIYDLLSSWREILEFQFKLIGDKIYSRQERE